MRFPFQLHEETLATKSQFAHETLTSDRANEATDSVSCSLYTPLTLVHVTSSRQFSRSGTFHHHPFDELELAFKFIAQMSKYPHLKN